MATRNIGIDVKPPATECKDKKCPFHGSLVVRGQVMTGVVKSASMIRSAVVTREYKKYIKKYERRTSVLKKYHVHVPGCISVKPGDVVKIAECRKLAKTISYVVVEKVTT
ncbi:30S ribosomal protein S17 [Thermogymnomonas acidicola]|uniref:Small ribosomal subunit protein uS17 n=1 Tax=Thermogymnomonas acidicola TaxID=399579 RepID=A0AA37BR39_9ARCH|nr:30S ribosomal protein S17 [Thermogymnomonas acidicola]GGM72023.1 30S ribosomal protein S17 [Thermogymnomonas acidicola]